MLRMHTSTNAEGARKYFEEGLSREDYYTQGREVEGVWAGRGAKLLGLEGSVKADAFHALCENRHPQSGEKLTPRMKANRRVGYDISFSVPKSVSIQHLVMGDTRIMEAFRDSVRETMEEMERDMLTRVRKGGKSEDRKTANLVWGEFVHFTARPVEGKSDPHLHCHSFTFNTTFDPVEGRWKAGQFGELKREARYYEAAFDARLAGRLRALGYGIERQGKGWELRGYDRELTGRFSRRTEEIDRIAEERGIKSPEFKGELGAKSRERKPEAVEKTEQRTEWLSRLSEEEKRRLAALGRGEGEQSGRGDVSAAQALGWAVSHGFERQSVISGKALMNHALRRGVGSVSVEEVRELVARGRESGEIIAGQIDGRAVVTHREVLAEEKVMLKFARDGKGAETWLGPEEFAVDEKFTGGQRAAIEHVLTSRDRVILVRGKAGTGKTTMMQEAVRGIAERGRQVFACAPTSAGREVLREDFPGAETVDRLLIDEKLQAQIRGQVIWVDEAGLLGARKMNALFKLAEEKQARVVLMGDVSQHRSVERGDALRILEDEAGLKPAEITEVRRQTRKTYREAVEAIGRGDLSEGFEKLEEMDAIREVEEESRYQRLGEDWLGKVVDGKQTALAVSPTHAEGRKVTGVIRDGLKEAGALGSEERRVESQVNLSWSVAEKSDAALYEPGLLVQFGKPGGGFARGARAEVVGQKDGEVRLRMLGGKEDVKPLPLDLADRFDVFRREEIGIASGERVRITRNGKALSEGENGRKKDLKNGTFYTVAGFTEAGDIVARGSGKSDAVVIGKDFANLAHGYCVTSHASQGQTVDHVLIAQSAESFPAASMEQFYVSVSRGRQSVSVYTDDREELREAVARSGRRISATELDNRTVFLRRLWEREREEREMREERARVKEQFGRAGRRTAEKEKRHGVER